ncbi:hypothetical protein KIPB_016967, partial [Kipferlia bialata]
NDSEITAVFVAPDRLSKWASLAASIPAVKQVILFDDRLDSRATVLASDMSALTHPIPTRVSAVPRSVPEYDAIDERLIGITDPRELSK